MHYQFALPVAYDLIAVFLFALTGALIAVKRGYDPVGVAIITIISGAGGGILRDSIFLNIRPSAMRDWRYAAVLFAALVAVLLARTLLRTRPIALLIIVTEALGIGLNSVYGTQRALDVKTSIYAAIIVGLINAVGGRLMRDTVMGKKRKNLVPGRMYGVAACGAVGVFLVMSEAFDLNVELAAWTSILSAFVIRLMSIKFDIKSKALIDYYDPSATLVHKVTQAVSPKITKVSKRSRTKVENEESD